MEYLNVFTQSHFSSIHDMIHKKQMIERERDEQIKQAFFFSSLFVCAIIIGVIMLGFLAVPHICSDTSERGKNTRLGLYALLLVSGGQIGWLYILLWIFKINMCL